MMITIVNLLWLFLEQHLMLTGTSRSVIRVGRMVALNKICPCHILQAVKVTSFGYKITEDIIKLRMTR